MEKIMSDFRWMIEAPGPRYIAVRKLGCYEFYWDADHNQALYFKTEPQADLTMLAIRTLAPMLFDFEKNLGNAKAVQHGWATPQD